jgi:hypothetical protein
MQRPIGLVLGLFALGLFWTVSWWGGLVVNAAEEPLKSPSRELLGRWDLTVTGPQGAYPSWIEVKLSGRNTLVGSYVGQFGSARPVAKFEGSGPGFRFVVPPQWENRTTDVVVEGKLEGDSLSGTVTGDRGEVLRWTGRRAPDLKRTSAPQWGQPIELFNGRDLAGWSVQHDQVKNGWKVINGVLTNAEPGNNLLTDRKFSDFQLQVEFRYPAKSNSGIYLRGRYELQIEDNHGLEAESHRIGGVYGHLTPAVNAAKPAGEWQTYEATLVGRVLTVVLNGERVIDRQVIPGITGGALDSDEGAPGPILLQGDHGPVEFRKVTLIPAE